MLGADHIAERESFPVLTGLMVIYTMYLITCNTMVYFTYICTNLFF